VLYKSGNLLYKSRTAGCSGGNQLNCFSRCIVKKDIRKAAEQASEKQALKHVIFIRNFQNNIMLPDNPVCIFMKH
jgi:hypothetical protein